MTAILGYADGTNVWIGGDSAAQNGYDAKFTILDRKVFLCGDCLLGVSGLTRVSQVLRAAFVPPVPEDGISDMDYMVTAFIQTLRKTLDDHRAAMKDDAGNSTAIMVGRRGVLYCVNTDLSIARHRIQTYNIGSGGDLALARLLQPSGAGRASLPP